MSENRGSNEIKKSMAYDLFEILDSSPEKEQYTPEEIKALVKAYIAGLSK